MRNASASAALTLPDHSEESVMRLLRILGGAEELMDGNEFMTEAVRSIYPKAPSIAGCMPSDTYMAYFRTGTDKVEAEECYASCHYDASKVRRIIALGIAVGELRDWSASYPNAQDVCRILEDALLKIR